MSGGLYSTDKRDFDKSLDLTKVKPYGDTMNDGKVQLSFTLPVEDGDKAVEAAKLLAKKMGLSDPSVAFHKALDKDFTFFVVYGGVDYTVDYTSITVQSVDVHAMGMEET